MPAQRRVALATVLGVITGAIAALLGPWQVAVLVGFDAWALSQVVWVGINVLPLNAHQTEAHSLTEDDSRTSALLAIVTAALACLVGVVLALIKAKQVSGAQAVVVTVVGVASVVLAWLTVHLVFVLRYADLYYNDGVGGIDFPGDEPPDYRDFAYFGFTVGMTYQVSDTNVSSRHIRRTVIRHALISFLFGTVIIGVTINLMAGFI